MVVEAAVISRGAMQGAVLPPQPSTPPSPAMLLLLLLLLCEARANAAQVPAVPELPEHLVHVAIDLSNNGPVRGGQPDGGGEREQRRALRDRVDGSPWRCTRVLEQHLVLSEKGLPRGKGV